MSIWRPIGVDEQPDEVLEGQSRLPAEPRSCLRRLSHQVVEFRAATDEARISAHVVAPVEAHVGERHLGELSHAVRLARRDHEVVGAGLLQHQPHRLHVVARVAPVSASVEVAEHELFLEPGGDARDPVRDLARQEVERAAGRPQVVEDVPEQA